jgi:hypothetical protein
MKTRIIQLFHAFALFAFTVASLGAAERPPGESAADQPMSAAIVDWAGPEKDTVQYSEDGVNFYVVASLEDIPPAGGA